MRARLLFSTLVMVLLLHPSAVRADGWVYNVNENPSGPPGFLAIDKKSQTFFYFKQQSPLEVMHKLPCTTGQTEGDKVKEGDLRTPEGIYFIDGKLTNGLDNELYGGIAYTLNFPNPVDVINGKTGHGIWIHGRGHSIVPNETQGCVALNTTDLRRMDDSLPRGLPVAIANQVSWTPDAPNREAVAAEAATLTQQVHVWANAWQNRSDKFFDFYDPEKFSLAEGKPFSFFKEHKIDLFRKNSWIHILVDDIHAIQGPDYWVTYFNQYYRTPTITSEGIKRLYWQKNKSGEWKIVGNEWEIAPLGMDKKYLALVQDEVMHVISFWRTAWEHADISKYIAYYDANAVQGDRRGAQDIESQKKTLWSSAKKPKKVEFEDVTLSLAQQGVQVEFKQVYQCADGTGDKGRKTLLLAPKDDSWVIVREDWSSL